MLVCLTSCSLLIFTRPTTRFAAPRLYPTHSADVKAERKKKKKKKISLPHPPSRASLAPPQRRLSPAAEGGGRPAVSAALFPRQPPAPSLLPPVLELPPFSLPTSSSHLPLQHGDGSGHGGAEAHARRRHDEGPRAAAVRWRPASSSAALSSVDLRARPALLPLSQRSRADRGGAPRG